MGKSREKSACKAGNMDSKRKKQKVESTPGVIKPLKKRKLGRKTRFSNLPHELVRAKILTKVPMTSLGAVRSTCKQWKALSRDWIFGNAAARQQFLGFMTLDFKVCSVRFGFFQDKDKDKDDFDLSIKQVDALKQVNISKVIHCDGLLLCIGEIQHGLTVWNPYLGQTRSVRPVTDPDFADRYALGYDSNRNHKILRLISGLDSQVWGYEMYDLCSDTWRGLDITADEVDIPCYQRGASLKGNTYFFAQHLDHELELANAEEIEDFLVCFDFTTERFGPRLPLPFHSFLEDTVTLSCVREEQLAVLHQQYIPNDIMEVWVTTEIDPKSVSWSKFFKVDMGPLTGFQFDFNAGSFFIDEEKKVVVVFDIDNEKLNHTAYIVGDDGYFKSVCLGEAPDVGKLLFPGIKYRKMYRASLVCTSSYYPSLVQINN